MKVYEYHFCCGKSKNDSASGCYLRKFQSAGQINLNSKGDEMTIFQMSAVLIAGLSLLLFGIDKKKKWAVFVSAILLLAVLSQIIILAGMVLH